MNITRQQSILFPPAIFFAIAMLPLIATVAPAQTQKAKTPQADQTEEVIGRVVPEPTSQAPAYDGPLVRGVVFEDVDGDGRLGDQDSRFAGVRVSNGKQIVKTDPEGKYELPIDDDSIIFVIKPTGYRTSLDENNLPKFYYVHKPNGSLKLKYPGVKKTGDVPRSVDFPLYRQSEPERFKMILFGDPQPRNQTEVDYATRDVIQDLMGTDAAFGVTLGDIAFDDLETLEPWNQSVALIGVPWYNVIGNHDINLDAKSRKDISQTFQSHYGPTYYSFDYGQVHFVVLDNIDWGMRDGRMTYIPNFGEQQLKFLETDLSQIPESQMVVILMHVPITSVKDRPELFKLIEKRPFCISVSAHNHVHKHLFLGEKEGWKGKEPHHHVINVTVSGSWWSGQKDERGIPHTMMADGAPNGYSMITFDQDNGYQMEFRGAGMPADKQMSIRVPNRVNVNQLAETDVWVNVFNGSEKSKTRMRIGNSKWSELEYTIAPDPTYVEIQARDVKANVEPKLTKPKDSFHLWRGKLPTGVQPGMHNLVVETTDMHGKTFTNTQVFRVTGELASKKEPDASKADDSSNTDSK